MIKQVAETGVDRVSRGNNPGKADRTADTPFDEPCGNGPDCETSARSPDFAFLAAAHDHSAGWRSTPGRLRKAACLCIERLEISWGPPADPAFRAS